jgi:hypothetical protein
VAVPLLVATSASADTPPGWQVSATVSTPDAPIISMQGAAASGPGNAWAVGSSTQSLIVEQWSAGAWSPVTVPAAFTDIQNGGVNDFVIGTSSATNTWVYPQVTGDSDQNYALHWNGKEWATFTLPGAPSAITGTAVAGPADVWVFGYQATPPDSLGVGAPYAAHYDGYSWRQVKLPVVPEQVSKASASDIWAVGPTAATAAGSGSSVADAALHWDGASWRQVALPAPAPVQGATWNPVAVTALSPSNVWVSEVPSVTNFSTGYAPDGTILLHWDGRQWSQVSEDSSLRAFGLADDGQGGLWMISQSPDYSQSYLVHYSGGTWTSQAAPSEPGYTTVLSPDGLVREPGTSTLWAAGGLQAPDIPGPGVILQYGS